MKYSLIDRTFDSENCPKSTAAIFEISALFRDAFFQFNSFYMLLYVQLVSPIIHCDSYIEMFAVISFVIIGIKILAGFCWTLASHLMEIHHFKYGNYRSMTFIGAFLTTIFFLMMFFVCPLFEGWGYVASFLICYALVECIYSLNDIGFWSITNKLSYDEKVRSRISSIANLLAAFGSYTVSSISPAVTTGDLKKNLTIIALVIIVCFSISQFIYCLVLRERKETAEWKPKKTKWYEALRILFTDGQAFLVSLAIGLYFIGQDVFISNSSTYFYYEYGYGSFGSTPYGNSMLSGGVVAFFFSICYGTGLITSNYLYIYAQRRIGKKKTMLYALSVEIVLFLLLFFFGFKSGYEPWLFIFTFLIGLSNGFIYMGILMNTYNVSDYYEYKTGKERSAAFVGLKALFIKTSNGIQTGVFYLVLLATGLMDINQQVAKLEAESAKGEVIDLVGEINATVHATDISAGMTGYRASLTFLPLAMITIAVLISAFAVKVTDEKNYAFYVSELKKRKEEGKTESLSD